MISSTILKFKILGNCNAFPLLKKEGRVKAQNLLQELINKIHVNFQIGK